MSFSQFVQSAWDANVLLSVLFELTYRCNWRCSFCYNDRGLKGSSVSTARYMSVFEEAKALGAMMVILTGGEPLLHPDFFTLGRKARELELLVRIKSNGHALTPVVAQRVKHEIDPFLIELSLHGGSPRTHDHLTGVRGSFARLVQNIKSMRSMGLRLGLNAPLTHFNEGEVSEMFALADNLGVPLRFDSKLTPRDNGDRSPLTLSASPEGVRRLQKLEAERAGRRPEQGRAALQVFSRNGKSCGAASASLAVDPVGGVFPCVDWRQPLGNIHTHSLGQLWTGAAADEARSVTTDIKARLVQEGTPGRRFCPGEAYKKARNPKHGLEGSGARGGVRTRADRLRVLA